MRNKYYKCFNIILLFILPASGLFVASKYPVMKTEVHTFPTSCSHHQFFYPSILMLKLHLGFEKRLDHNGPDKQCSDQDSEKAHTPKHGRRKIGFVANVNSPACCNGGKNAKRSQWNSKSEIRGIFDDFRRQHTNFAIVQFSVISGEFCIHNVPPECKQMHNDPDLDYYKEY